MEFGQGLDAGSAGQFTSTHWTVVLTAGQGLSREADAALEQLCRTYWLPIYTFVRRRGHDAHEAEDLTQEFFARLLERRFLKSVDPAKGRFRSFLLSSLEHFLANEWRRSQAQKRGGGATHLSLDETSAEQRYQQFANSNELPGVLYDRQWAMTLLDRTVSNLREEFRVAGKLDLFNHIKVFLTGDKPAASYATFAGKLDTSEAALKMAVSRMRRRYGELLRAEIGRTVASPDDIDGEIRALFAALA